MAGNQRKLWIRKVVLTDEFERISAAAITVIFHTYDVDHGRDLGSGICVRSGCALRI